MPLHRIALVTVALVGCAVLSAAAQVKKSEMAGIRNFSRVDATVGCGGAVDPAAMAGLRKEGFVSVINLRLANEPGADVDAGRAAAQAAGLKYIHLPFNAASPDSKVVESFLAAVADKANQPVFIHCGSANRVGGVWMIKRVLQDGWAVDKARTEAEAIGLSSPQLVAFATDYINTHKK
ncbi:MAG TPA: sulfur transferase domain-containing protein [Vicinamibacterales bacterium]